MTGRAVGSPILAAEEGKFEQWRVVTNARSVALPGSFLHRPAVGSKRAKAWTMSRVALGKQMGNQDLPRKQFDASSAAGLPWRADRSRSRVVRR